VGLGVAPFVTLIGGLVGAAVLGVLLELTAFRPIRRRSGSFLAPIVSSIGAGVVLQEVMTKLFGAEQIPFPQQFAGATYQLGPIAVSGAHLFILAVAFASMTALHVFVTRSRTGMAMRATAENIGVAAILGINVDTVILVTFVVASALAGIAGVLVGINYNAISPFMGVEMTTKAMAVMLIGGLGSIYGAMAGGLLLGMVEVISVAYL